MEKTLTPADKKDNLFFILFYLLSAISVDFTIYGSLQLGFSISCFALFLAVAIYLKSKRLRITPFSIFCMLAMLLFAAIPAIYNSPGIKMLSLLAVICLSALALCKMCNLRKFPENSYLEVLNVPYLWMIRSIEELHNAFSSIFMAGEEKKGRPFLKILIGLGCAVPAVFIILPLLMRSDAAFEGLIAKTIFHNFGRLLVSAIVGGILFLFLFPAFFALRKNDAQPTLIAGSTHKMDATILTAFLGAVSFFYILYLISQLAYFFSAFSRILPENYTFAGYARRGFFEMSILCAINFAMVFLAVILVKTKENGKLPLSLRIIASFISLFSILLIVTAFSKMYFYIQTYGLTRLRITTCAFMAALFITFTILLLRLFIRFPYMKVLLCLVTCLLLAVCFADVDTMAVKYNTWAYESGRHSSIDLEAPEYASDAAVPYLLSLLEDDDPTVVDSAKALLCEKYDIYRDNTADFRSYNYTREKALRLLTENRKLFY